MIGQLFNLISFFLYFLFMHFVLYMYMRRPINDFDELIKLAPKINCSHSSVWRKSILLVTWSEMTRLSLNKFIVHNVTHHEIIWLLLKLDSMQLAMNLSRLTLPLKIYIISIELFNLSTQTLSISVYFRYKLKHRSHIFYVVPSYMKCSKLQHFFLCFVFVLSTNVWITVCLFRHLFSSASNPRKCKFRAPPLRASKKDSCLDPRLSLS